MPQTAHDLRCFCTRKPLLGKYGRDADGLLYIHVRVYKQTRMYGEFVFHGGLVRLRCRECLRWHKVTIHQTVGVKIKPEELPPGIAV